jgi:hypothetical protein
MIGSFLIAYPTPHTGGVLVFSKDDKSWFLDSGSLLPPPPTTLIAYAAFSSDTDHEVLPVTSGHRVTVNTISTSRPAAARTATMNYKSLNGANVR